MASRPEQDSNKTATTKRPLAPYPPRLPTETEPAHAAFCLYLDAGPTRSIRGVFNAVRLRHIGEWSRRNDWQARAALWDAAVRDARLAAVQEREREADLATAEHDHSLRSAAAAALLDPDPFGLALDKLPPALANMGRLARSAEAGNAAIQAVKLLYHLSGIRDLRHLTLVHASRVTPDLEVAADPAVVAAVASASPEQLAAMRPAPVSVADEYACDPDEDG